MEDDDGINPFWSSLIGFIIGFAIVYAFIDSKYEGQTAEEWFNAYDEVEARYQEFRSCVEDYDNFDIETKLSYGGMFYYCE